MGKYCHACRYPVIAGRCVKCPFVEPPIAEPQPGENVVAVIAKRQWAALIEAGGDQLDYTSLVDACDAAYAAGRARGIEDAVARALEYCRANDEWSGQAIAYAIAKETK